MPFLKLDVSIMNSSVWIDRDVRDVFVTALLMAEPHELREPEPQIEVRTLNQTGFVVPPGWYGFIAAAGIGIINRSLVEKENGYAALEKLGSPDIASRSQIFEGRRLVRINHGFLVLNFIHYREKDHTAGERAKRYRQRKNAQSEGKNKP